MKIKNKCKKKYIFVKPACVLTRESKNTAVANPNYLTHLFLYKVYKITNYHLAPFSSTTIV